MRRIPSRLLAIVLPLLPLTAACSDGDEAAVSSTTVSSSTAAETTDTTEATETTAETSTTTTEPADTTSSETTEPAPDPSPDDEVALLCTAYLESITPAGFESGLTTLADLLGTDAPTGVAAAIETLQDPDNDIEAFFAARNSIDGYVLPICNERFRSGIVPAADNATAADAFIEALRAGDRDAAEQLAPTNVIVQFDWVGYPEMSADVNDDSTTMSLILEPTVTVFCQIDGGAVEFCAFGE